MINSFKIINDFVSVEMLVKKLEQIKVSSVHRKEDK